VAPSRRPYRAPIRKLHEELGWPSGQRVHFPGHHTPQQAVCDGACGGLAACMQPVVEVFLLKMTFFALFSQEKVVALEKRLQDAQQYELVKTQQVNQT
jgi:hypothetical protein